MINNGIIIVTPQQIKSIKKEIRIFLSINDPFSVMKHLIAYCSGIYIVCRGLTSLLNI